MRSPDSRVIVSHHLRITPQVWATILFISRVFWGIFIDWMWFIMGHKKVSRSSPIAHVVEMIVDFGKSMRLEMNSEDVAELMNDHKEEPITEDLQDVEVQQTINE